MATKSSGDKKVPLQHGTAKGNGGKTDADMLKLGRGLAKVANQNRSK